MRNILIVFAFVLSFQNSFSQKQEVVNYNLPDSVKAIAFLTDIKISSVTSRKEFQAGIRDNDVSVYLETNKNDFEFVFEFPKTATVNPYCIWDIKKEKGELSWLYKGSTDDTYKLLLATASDSTENFTIYSGYAFLPKENKWKLVGSCKVVGRWGTLKMPEAYFKKLRKDQPSVNFSNTWCQRSNGSWKSMNNTTGSIPVINLFAHIDSARQMEAEKLILDGPLPRHGRTLAEKKKDDVYYTILKEGTGKQVNVTDTVTVHYKGYLLSDGTVFDQTKDKPATFPLSRLIKGWQIGVPLCRVGGKIKLVIPSSLAYSIRTRAAKIPPNSILVFEIEVVDAIEKK